MTEFWQKINKIKYDKVMNAAWLQQILEVTKNENCFGKEKCSKLERHFSLQKYFNGKSF